ncbi:MAG: O-antigen ligase family protein [Candidatus Vogelbacteria bacterium]|nr:O-antigen ligase family protein [Candidatus Vogelbacteria bacterium]
MTTNKLLRYLIYAGLAAITLTPLIVTPTCSQTSCLIKLSLFFPFITGKNFFFRIVVELIFGLWLVLAYRDKTARPRSSWILWSLFGYLIIMTLATIFGLDPSRSFWSNFERMEGLLAYIHSFAFFLVAISVLKTRELWHRLFQASLGVSLIVSWNGLMQLAGKADIHQSGSRIDATLGNSAYMAVYMLFHLFLSGYLLATTRNKIAKWVYGAIIILESTLLYYTATRGAVLGAIGGAVLVSIILAWKYPGRVRRAGLSALGVIVVLILLFISVRNTAFVQKSNVLARFAKLSLNDSSLLAREQIWAMSWQGFKEHPVLGWGPENYPLVFQKYYSPEMYGQEPWFDRSHNIALDNLVNAGILGLLAYLALFGSALYYLLWKKNGEAGDQAWVVKAIFVGLLAGYFFQNLTIFDQLISTIMFYLVLGYIHVGATENSATVSPAPAREGDGAWLPFVALFAVILTVSSVYYFNVRGMTVSAAIIRGISGTDPNGVLTEFKNIFSYSEVTGLAEAREQLLSVSTKIIGSQSVPLPVKQEFLQLANDQMAKQFSADDADARAHLLYGSFLQGIGDPRAIGELEKARAYSPKKQMILFQLGAIYLGQGKNDESLALFKEAYDGAPAFIEAGRMYALAALYAGRKDLAESILSSAPDRLAIENDDRFLGYFATTKQYGKIIEIWKLRVAANPKDRQTNISLAASYYFSGDRAAAVKVVSDYIKLDPAFEKEGDDLIKQIELGQIK